MSAYNFPTTTEVTTLESTTLDSSTVNNYNFIDNEKPVPATKFRGILKALKDIIAWLKADDEAWISATLANSWANYGLGFSTTQYYKNKNNRVYIKGLVKDGTITPGTTIFTLPVGYRPAQEMILLTSVYRNSPAAFSRAEIRITTTGVVKCQDVPYNGYLSLDNISFRV